MRILLIEDDKLLGQSLKTGLSDLGITVDLVDNGKLGLAVANSSEPFDAVLLDLGLPGLDGIEVLRALKRNKDKVNLPVLIITARDQVQDKILGLDSGAQDYIVKPFHLDELAARLRAAVRSKSNTSPILTVKDISFDPAQRIVTQAGKMVALSARELNILEILMQNPGKAFMRQDIEDKLLGWGDEVMSNVIEVHIYNIRKKLGSDFIHHIRGVGYFISTDS